MCASEELCGIMYLCVTKGQSGDGLCEASALCKYDSRNGDLFVLN